MWNWRRPLRMLLRELNVESALFESSCERFLEGAGDTGGMGGVTILMTGENGNGEWSEFHTKLALHMGKDIADTFIYEATQMHGYLKKLETKLHLDDFTIQDLVSLFACRNFHKVTDMTAQVKQAQGKEYRKSKITHYLDRPQK